MTSQKVSDLTVTEFRELIRETLMQTLAELTEDPDAGLELREEFVAEVQRRMAAAAAGEPAVPIEEVAKRYELD
jgi:hypothetical protein